MTSPTHLDKCIQCPKCGTKTMRKSVGKGPEYFDDKCHSYFTVEELVNKWGYDSGDFYDGMPNFELARTVNNLVTKRDFNKLLIQANQIHKMGVGLLITYWDTDTMSDLFEGDWGSKLERDLAYEEVTTMQLGIPSWSMEDYSVDTGAIHA